MKISAFVLLASLFGSSADVCRANLGESEAQCIARYGTEADSQDSFGYDVVGDKAAVFQLKTPNGSFAIKVIFFNGVASHEAYSNADAARGLSEDQMKAILNLESAGLKWRKGHSGYRTGRSDETSETEEWLRSDGATSKCWMSGKAASGRVSGEIELSTKEYAIAQQDLDKRDGAN